MLNLGRNASEYYTEDAEFHGQFASYMGVKKIQQFYDWRRDQGPASGRALLHQLPCRVHWPGYRGSHQLSVPVCQERREGAADASAHHHLAGDGSIHSSPNGRWLCTYRRFEHLFEGDTPITNPKLDDAK